MLNAAAIHALQAVAPSRNIMVDEGDCRIVVLILCNEMDHHIPRGQSTFIEDFTLHDTRIPEMLFYMVFLNEGVLGSLGSPKGSNVPLSGSTNQKLCRFRVPGRGLPPRINR